MNVYFSGFAEQDLIDIYHFIAIENHAQEQADKFISELRASVIDQLSQFPKSGQALHNNSRFITFKKYVITYFTKGGDVIITEIHPPGKNWR